MWRRYMLYGFGEVDFVDFPALKIIIWELTVQTIDFADELFYLADFIHINSPWVQAVFLDLLLENSTANRDSIGIAVGTIKLRAASLCW